jgi:multiple antibiotic resistance protein
MSFRYEALVFFLALFALYSPVAALSSYLPYVRGHNHREQARLALGLALNAFGFVLIAIWVGEPLLELLGISTAALTATGGIALILASVPLMRGSTPPPDEDPAPDETPATGNVLFTPLTFPLTVGGTTFAFGVAASADVGDVPGRWWLTLAALAYGIVAGVTLYVSGHVERRISAPTAAILDRVAGILLTAIAVILLANGFTDLVTTRLA